MFFVTEPKNANNAMINNIKSQNELLIYKNILLIFIYKYGY